MALRYRPPAPLVRSALTLAVLAVATLAQPARAQTYVDEIDPAGTPALWGLAWHDGALYATDTNPDRLIQVDASTGAVTPVATLAFDPRGLAWDGTHWRVSTGFDSSDPRINTVDGTGAVVGSIPAPGALTHGLTLHDGRLFAAQAYPDDQAAIRGLDPASGAVLESVAFPSTQPGGLVFIDPNTAWATNVGDDSGSSGVYALYRIDRATGTVLQTFGLPPGTSRPRGLAYDGTRYLYVVVRRDAAPFDWLIYKIDLQSAGNAQASVSAPALDFGPRTIGDTYALPLTISNIGDGPLEISDVQVTHTGQNPFGTTLTATTVPPGAQVTVDVTFMAIEALRSAGTLSFETNDVTNPAFTIPLSGIGVFADPTVAYVEAGHDFGPVRVDQPMTLARSTGWWPLRIVNLGAQTLTVSDVTYSDPAFRTVDPAFPMQVLPSDTVEVLVEFRPTEVRAYSATAAVASDAPGTAPTAFLMGLGIDPVLAGGTPLWQWTVPDNPATSSDDLKVFALRVLGDVTGDGKPELALATANYWTLVIDPNGWSEPRLLWAFNSCPDNVNCGAASGNAQLYEYGLAAGMDLNGDGSPDVVIGTEGGNDHVYALDGRTGAVIWAVGSDSDPYLASYYSVSPRVDVTGDGVPDVATGTGSADLANSPNPYNHRVVYLLDGATGAPLWQAGTPLPNFRTSLIRTAEGPRVVTGGGEGASHFLRAYDAATGGQDWTTTPSFTPFLVEPIADTPGGADEDVLVAGLGALVQRIDGATGAEVWTASAGGSSVWDLDVAYRAAGAPLVITGSTGTDVRALDAATGLEAWQYDLGGQVFDVAAVPDADGDGTDDVAATGRAGVTVLLSGASGTPLWTHTFGNDTFDQSGETVVAVPDLEGNGVPEVAFGVRDGRIVLLFGGGGTVGTPAEPGAPPAALALDAPAPNPARGAATLRYALPAASDVALAVYDALGRRVWHHAAAGQPAGRHAVTFDAGALAAGVYVVRLEADGAARTQRLVVTR